MLVGMGCRGMVVDGRGRSMGGRGGAVTVGSVTMTARGGHRVLVSNLEQWVHI